MSIDFINKRNPMNTNQVIHQGDRFNGLPIQQEHGMLIEDYLIKAYNCFDKALEDYTRVCMMRFDLQIPENYSPENVNNNILMSKFFVSLKEKIISSQTRSERLGHRVHYTNLRYLWCRESSSFGRIHYHVAILLNYNAYAFIGDFDLESNNMYTRVHEAWASALYMYPPDTVGLIHIPENPVYQIHRGDFQSLASAFYRVSYFCKMATKEYGLRFHSFGSSRN